LGSLSVLDPQAEDLAGAVGTHAQGQVDGLVAHHVVLPDLDPQGVEERQGDRADELRVPGGEVRGVNVAHDDVGKSVDIHGHTSAIAFQQAIAVQTLEHRKRQRLSDRTSMDDQPLKRDLSNPNQNKRRSNAPR